MLPPPLLANNSPVNACQQGAFQNQSRHLSVNTKQQHLNKDSLNIDSSQHSIHPRTLQSVERVVRECPIGWGGGHITISRHIYGNRQEEQVESNTCKPKCLAENFTQRMTKSCPTGYIGAKVFDVRTNYTLQGQFVSPRQCYSTTNLEENLVFNDCRKPQPTRPLDQNHHLLLLYNPMNLIVVAIMALFMNKIMLIDMLYQIMVIMPFI